MQHLLTLFSICICSVHSKGPGGLDLDSIGLDMEGLGDVVKEIQSVMEMFGGKDGTCGKRCSVGETLIRREGYEPSYNGCGTLGAELNLDDLPQIRDCCNDHDLCYDTCNANRTECDVEFKQCTHNMCVNAASKDTPGDKVEQGIAACKSVGDMLFQTTSLLGCQSFKKSQEQACVCVNDDIIDGNDDVIYDTRDEL